jgi:hypothetical protein
MLLCRNARTTLLTSEALRRQCIAFGDSVAMLVFYFLAGLVCRFINPIAAYCIYVV